MAPRRSILREAISSKSASPSWGAVSSSCRSFFAYAYIDERGVGGRDLEVAQGEDLRGASDDGVVSRISMGRCVLRAGRSSGIVPRQEL